MTHYHDFLVRNYPTALFADEPPPGWEGPEVGWLELRNRARAYWEGEQAMAFLNALDRGWTSHELAAGQLDSGASIALQTGLVVRPLPGAPSHLRQRAAAILADMRNFPGVINGILESTISMLAYGQAVENQGVERQLEEAERLLSEARSAREAQRAAVVADGVLVSVPATFRALGRTYSAGRYHLKRAEVDDLVLWRQRMEHQARERGWDAPLGFESGTWPPFTLRVASPAGMPA